MPTALITISGRYVSFRLRAISPRQFNVFLGRLKHQFPSMHWNPVERVWQLPPSELKKVYEACRSLFGPAHVDLVTDYKPSVPPFQPRLLE